ncbi:hypothetical protein [Haloarchaeobius iranensis]|uniref:Uncharacterized protein n=1 Tax=Haloarchaeobius iranensis TaxID=996166 RepID=A0A1G9WY79_9EURY|nr:hypothetical protein [Haloarchaeobius iranensis]SDM89460.1 hypothetical protein SAMN05192554_10948 [Haloarchaeobius iranensis]
MKRTETDHVDVESLVRPSTVLDSVSRYDLVLGVIPLLWLAAAAFSVATAFPLHLLTAAVGVGSSIVVADALFVHPPTRERREGRQQRRSPRGEFGD